MELYTREGERQDKFSWEMYRQFHESAPIGYLVLDINNIILDVNITGAKLLGTPREKLIKSQIEQWLPIPIKSPLIRSN